MTLTVEKSTNEGRMGVYVSWPEDHPKSAEIDKLLEKVSPKYVEYYLEKSKEPNCMECKLSSCSHCGTERVACRSFKLGDDW